MIKITSNQERVIESLQKLKDIPEPNVWNDVEKVVSNEIKLIFDTKGYGTWDELSERTIRLKDGDRRILRHTDRMYRALTEKGAEGNISLREKNALIWGLDLSKFPNAYPAVHETGSRFVPARPIMKLLNNVLKDKLVNVIQENIRRCLSRIFVKR